MQCRSKEIGKLACIGGLELFFGASSIESEGHSRALSTLQAKTLSGYYKPTSEELQQGVAFAAPKYWGVHLRRSKSLRIAFIGGSQTSSGDEYVGIFRDSMKEATRRTGWNLAVYKEGMNGTYPSTQSLKFLRLQKSDWPNVICIEPCLHCEVPDHWPCSYAIDNMKHFINRQYKEVGLDPPSYMFLEFFADIHWQRRVEWSNGANITSSSINQSRAKDLSDQINKRMLSRGAPYALYMMDLARFYGIPVLSVTDVLYPSWVRFFLTHAENEHWPYTADGMHFGIEGCQLITEQILKPFFLDQMMPRDSDKLYEKKLQFDPYPAEVRMFPFDQYKFI